MGSKGQTSARGQCTAKDYYNIETSLIIRNKDTGKNRIEKELKHSALVLIDCKIIGRLLYGGRSYGVIKKAGSRPAFFIIVRKD